MWHAGLQQPQTKWALFRHSQGEHHHTFQMLRRALPSERSGSALYSALKFLAGVEKSSFIDIIDVEL